MFVDITIGFIIIPIGPLTLVTDVYLNYKTLFKLTAFSVFVKNCYNWVYKNNNSNRAYNLHL